MKKIVEKIMRKIRNLDNFSVLVIKMEIILSIGYFIIAIVCKATINFASSVVLETTNIINFTRLGFINFIISIIFGLIFDINLKRLKKS